MLAKQTHGVYNLSNRTSQKNEQATSKVFAGYTSKEIYTIANFQASNGLHQSRPWIYNYTINYLIIMS